MGILDFYARTAVVGKAITEGVDVYKNADKHADIAVEAQHNTIALLSRYLPEWKLMELTKPQLAKLSKAIGVLNIFAASMVFLGRKRRFMAFLLIIITIVSEVTHLLSTWPDSWKVDFSNMLAEASLLKQIFTHK